MKESANCSAGSFYVKRQDARIPIVLGELPRTNERELVAGWGGEECKRNCHPKTKS